MTGLSVDYTNFEKMRKINSIVSLLFLAVVLYQCSPGKNIEYNIYEGLQPEDKAYILTMVESGQGLYKEYCSQCHGIFSKGKDHIPNFSKEAMDDYKTSFVMKDEKNHSVATNITSEELDQILMFLTFYKRD